MNALINFFKKPFWRKYSVYVVIGAFTLIAGTLSMTVMGPRQMNIQSLFGDIAIRMLLALSLCLVVGFLGELSLGHAGFMVVGMFVGGRISVLISTAMNVQNTQILAQIPAFLISLLVGGLAAALLGFLVGLPALRLRGDYLAIVTLAFGEIVLVLIRELPQSWFGAAYGMDTPRLPDKVFFIAAFLVLLACVAWVKNLMSSKHGRAIISIKDNEIAAKATGIDVTKYKLFVFVFSSFMAGVAGVLYSYKNYNIKAEEFNFNYSIEILIIVVLGGMGSINGALIAGALITFLNWLLQMMPGSFAQWRNFIYAIILIAIVIYRNAPSLKHFREKYNFDTFGKWLKRKLGGKTAEENAEQEVAENDGQ